jgi:hypothetical protein
MKLTAEELAYVRSKGRLAKSRFSSVMVPPQKFILRKLPCSSLRSSGRAWPMITPDDGILSGLFRKTSIAWLKQSQSSSCGTPG